MLVMTGSDANLDSSTNLDTQSRYSNNIHDASWL